MKKTADGFYQRQSDIVPTQILVHRVFTDTKGIQWVVDVMGNPTTGNTSERRKRPLSDTLAAKLLPLIGGHNQTLLLKNNLGKEHISEAAKALGTPKELDTKIRDAEEALEDRIDHLVRNPDMVSSKELAMEKEIDKIGKKLAK